MKRINRIWYARIYGAWVEAGTRKAALAMIRRAYERDD